MLSVGCVVKQLPLELMPATGMGAQARPAATAPPDGARGPAAGQPANQGERQAEWRTGRAQWPTAAATCADLADRLLPQLNSSTLTLLDTLGIEPRASRMLSGCDTTTPRAPYNSWVGCTITKCHTRFIWLRARLTSGRGGVPTHVVSGLRREAAAPGADACNRDGGTGQACSNSAS